MTGEGMEETVDRRGNGKRPGGGTTTLSRGTYHTIAAETTSSNVLTRVLQDDRESKVVRHARTRR
ncbi:hypothetical protein OB919_06015 [Halobacteria archaeon AArc-curdl1]|uniref:Uncharacterized protein n=1 Tax=Natronosalvus hydrolyticus TaxID=2979988 RepID=A0AAP2Z6V8_9EURY|nr:hypothetical protein [Halobacteria archaeon AArc-curdl1]